MGTFEFTIEDYKKLLGYDVEFCKQDSNRIYKGLLEALVEGGNFAVIQEKTSFVSSISSLFAGNEKKSNKVKIPVSYILERSFESYKRKGKVSQPTPSTSTSFTKNQAGNHEHHKSHEGSKKTFIFGQDIYTPATESKLKIGTNVVWMLPNHLWNESNPYIGQVELVASRETGNGLTICAIVEFYQGTSTLLNYIGPPSRNRNFIPVEELMLLEEWRKTVVDNYDKGVTSQNSNVPPSYGWAIPSVNKVSNEQETSRSRSRSNLSFKDAASEDPLRILQSENFDRDNKRYQTLPRRETKKGPALPKPLPIDREMWMNVKSDEQGVSSLRSGPLKHARSEETLPCTEFFKDSTMTSQLPQAEKSIERFSVKITLPTKTVLEKQMNEDKIPVLQNIKNEFEMYSKVPANNSPFKIDDKVVWMLPTRETGSAFCGEIFFVGYEMDSSSEKNIIAVVQFHRSTSHLPGYLTTSPPNRNAVNANHLILSRQFEEMVKMKLLDLPSSRVEEKKEIEFIGNCVAVHGGFDTIDVDGIKSGDFIKMVTKITTPIKEIFGDIMMTCKLKGFGDDTYVGVKFHQSILEVGLPINFRHHENKEKAKCQQCEGGKLAYVLSNYLTNGVPGKLREKISFVVYGKKSLKKNILSIY